MIDYDVQQRGEQIIAALEEANDDLAELRAAAANSAAAAKKAHAIAMLDAISDGASNADHRKALADLAAADAEATAAISERTYRDKLTYIYTLQAQLGLVQTTMVSQRQIQV